MITNDQVMLTGFSLHKSIKDYIPYILVAVSIMIAIILNSADKGPLLPPFPKNFYSIDCQSLEYEGYDDRNGYIDFKFYTKPSIEYPPEYLPHFV